MKKGARTERVGRRSVAAGMRLLALLQSFLLIATTSCVPWAARVPEPGVLEYRSPLALDLPGGRLDLAGGNFLHRRVDLSIDTLFGVLEVGASYNSSSGRWLWVFEMSYDGETFIDETGAVHEIALLADGAAIPGTHWVKVDSQRIKTKGGLLHHFGSSSHRLVALTGLDGIRPALVFFLEWEGGAVRTRSVAQCRGENTCRLVYSVEYDAHSCVAALQDRAGRRAEFENDASCRPIVARDGLDVARGWPGRRYEYDGDLLIAITNSEGDRVDYEYAAGRLSSVQQQGVEGPFANFSYGFEPSRELFYSVVDDARGGHSVYRYDADARVHEIDDAAGDITQMAWSGRRLSHRVEPDGATTRWFYENDDPVRVELPSGNVVHYEYAMSAQDRRHPLARPLARKFDSLGVIEERTYDSEGRLASITDGSGDSHGFFYDSEGMLAVMYPSNGAGTWTSEYGEHGHAEIILHLGKVTRRVFDAVGNLLESPELRERMAPGRPGMRRRGFDEDRNLVSLERVGEIGDAARTQEVASFTFAYRSDGQPAAIQRPYGGDTAYEYDGAGRLVERRDRVDGAWHSQVYEYSPGGDVRAVELPNGMRSQAVHDAAGRPTRLTYFRDGVPESSVGLIWQAGRLRHLMDSRRPGLETLDYDSAGRVVSVRYPEGETLERTYDLRSREIARRFVLTPGAQPFRSLEFSYDLANRPILVFDQGEQVLDRRFSEGRIEEIHYGNGLVRSFSYSWDAGSLEATDLRDAAGVSLLRTALSWSECHVSYACLSAFTLVDPSPSGSVPLDVVQENYVMGPRAEFLGAGDSHGGRVEAWAPHFLNVTGLESLPRYGFDVLGNWLGVMGGAYPVGPFSFNAERNRLVASDRGEHHDYAWDEAGFLALRDGVSFTWNAAGLLTGIGESVALEWDSLGRPISAMSPSGFSRTLFGGTVSGDANRQPTAIDLGEVKIGFSGQGRIYRHHDFRGNVQAVSDEDGDLQKFYTYSPFGVAESSGTGADGANFARGQALGEFVLLGARIYEPETGRFLSPDPVYHPINQFAYTLGNPLTFWDPGGRTSEMNPMATPTSVARNAARVSVSLGAVLLEAGGQFKSAALVVLGLGFLLWAVLATVIVMYRTGTGLGKPTVSIEDMAAGGWPEGEVGNDPFENMPGPDVIACSPLSVQTNRSGAWAFPLLVPLQMLMAGLWITWLRRRRERPHSGGE